MTLPVVFPVSLPLSAAEVESTLDRARPGFLALSCLVPWDKNPRAHDPEQVRLLAESIRTHGYIRPIMLQEGTNRIVAGHGTRLALLSLVPEGMDPQVPVVWARLSDKEAASYAVADNRLTDLSTWDLPVLQEVMVELDTSGWNLEASGFAPGALEALLGGPKTTIKPGVDPEDAPPLPAVARTVRGELIILGSHRLLCGDATDPDDWNRLMDGRRAALVVTDPPYNVAYESSAADLKAGGKASIKNDALSDADFQAFLDAVFRQVSAHSEKRAAFYVFYPSRFHTAFETALNRSGLEVRAQIIWVKNAASFGFAQYKWKHEPVLQAAREGEVPLVFCPAHESAFYAFRAGNSPYWEGDRSQTTVWSVARETGYVHPTQKPVELLHRPLLNSSRPGFLVLDPFGGSGSTLMTCEILGRSCLTMELDPKFCDVIVQRWEEATGQTAQRIPPPKA